MTRYIASRCRVGRRHAEIKSPSDTGTGPQHPNNPGGTITTFIGTILVALVGIFTGCQSITDRRDVRPLVLRDVPSQRLAYRFEADTNQRPDAGGEETTDKLEAIQVDFNTRRPDDALLRTVISPDKQRALALYGTESEPSSAFRIDLYSIDGKFLRNLTPPDLSCVFPETVSWSTDSNFIAFIGHKGFKPTPSPTPIEAPEVPPEAVPSPSVGPAFAPVTLFSTEQIYICNRDGFDLKPLTTREGLIYFYFAWAPDNHGLVALACREGEWDAREREYKMPAGRPRLIGLDGKERLLDDALTEALPVWSPDSSKVATAFDTDVAIYDAGGKPPTQARIPLREALIKASIAYEEKNSKEKAQEPGVESTPASLPASFNPMVRLEWPKPETLYFQTAYVRLIPNDIINTFQRWHLVILSPQAAVLK